MADLSDIIQATLRNRSSALADNVTSNNAILKWLIANPPPQPTLRQRIEARIRRLREQVGFAIAGHDPRDEDW